MDAFWTYAGYMFAVSMGTSAVILVAALVAAAVCDPDNGGNQ